MDGSPSISPPSTRTLLVVGSFLLLFGLTVGAAVSTSAALTAHMEAEVSVDAEVVTVEPADGVAGADTDADAIDVQLRVRNPTHAEMEFFSAYMPVSRDGEVVASNAGLGFDATTVPAGETRTFTITAVAASGVDGDALHEAAEAGELRPEGRVEGRIVDRTFHVSIEPSSDPETDLVAPETDLVAPETDLVAPETDLVAPETDLNDPETTQRDPGAQAGATDD